MRYILLMIILCMFLCSCSADEFDDPKGNPKRAEWMSGKYGMMTHYLPSPKASSDSLGAFTTPEEKAKMENVSEEEKTADFNRIVDNFNLDLYMKQFDQSGAEYLIFTVGQNTRYYTSYNSVIEKVTPGHCSKRDLVIEIAKEIKKRGKHFIFYIPCDSRWIDDGSGYYETWTKVCEEYSKKMGKLCDGWWIDGCNVADVNGPAGEKLARAMRSGNPKAALGFSDASFAGNSLRTTIQWNDYFPGEVHVVEDGYIRHDCLFLRDFPPYLDNNGYVRVKNEAPKFFVPKEKYLDGVLLHALIPMDLTFNPYVPTEWVPYKAKDCIALAHSFTNVGGAITFNVPLEIDGKIPQASLDKLISIGNSYKGANKNKKYPLDPKVLKRAEKVKIKNPNPKNIAFDKPAKLLSWDTLQNAIPSAGFASADKGCDGNFETGAAAAYYWNWTYEMDLKKVYKISKIDLYFLGWSTDFDIFVSKNHEDWDQIKHVDNSANEKKFTFDVKTSFRYIRVRSNKPDGEGQTGGQMSVAELQIFQ